MFAQNIDCGYTLEPPPRRGGSNEYPQSMFWNKNKKISIPLTIPVLIKKKWFKGVYISQICFPDEKKKKKFIKIAVFSIMKTSLFLKMSNAYTSQTG